MKTTYTHKQAFTLVEIIVSITIFSIMLISVMSIFIFASQMSTRVEINRVMQENIKNVIEDISENVRKNSINWVQDGLSWWCKLPLDMKSTEKWDKLCIWWNIEYTIGKKDPVSGDWERSSNIEADCGDIDDICYILKKDSSGDYYPLSSNFIHFENIKFLVTNTDIPKLTIQILARPAYKKGLPTKVIKNNSLSIQTSLSERLIETH